MTSEITVETRVNGVRTERSVPARMTLATFLRDELGLTGTKLSCELQVCGVCTVLVDRQPVSSCTYLAADAHGRSVQTVEGLMGDGELHPLQQAFMDRSALQCGFCTPGFIMMADALLEREPDPDAEQIVEWLEGNICRCTGYQPIIEAVQQAATQLRGSEVEA